MSIRATALGALCRTTAPQLFRPFVREATPIFMLHRFSHPEGVAGHSLNALRANLAYLRRERYDIVPLWALMADSDAGPRAYTPRVALTVDDCYFDFIEAAAPIFAEFDCPVTTFVATGAIDRSCWYWWDRIAYLLETTTRSAFDFELDGVRRQLSWTAVEDRTGVIAELVDWLGTTSEVRKLEGIERLSVALDVEIPHIAPRRYSTATWDELRSWASRGIVAVGPHSVTHPLLPRTSDQQAESEIRQSWMRLRDVIPSAVPVFAYPGGAYTEREIVTLQDCGLRGALTTEPRYASPRAFASVDGAQRYRVPRFAYEEVAPYFIQVVSGIERVKLGIRHGARGWYSGGATEQAG